MIYLASPYSHPDPLIMKTRFLLAEQVTAKLLGEGLFVYSPIVHCHELGLKYSLPTDFAFWKKYNFDMIRRCSVLFVLSIDGWELSKGVRAEWEFAKMCNLYPQHINPDGLMSWMASEWPV